MKVAAPLMAMLVGAAVFYLYSYNSGYGYDALEYLVIGREITRGTGLFEFAPSKGPGIYYFSAACTWMFGQMGHAELAAVITALQTCCVVATYAIARRIADSPMALVAAAFTYFAAAATEQNFLETEPFVLLSALGAIALVAHSHGIAGGYSRAFVAGVLLGTGALFKAVALAYVPGVALAILLFQPQPITRRIACVGLLGGGALLPIGMCWGWFAAHNSAAPFFYWSFSYPLTEYPGDSDFALKTALKLGWLALAALALPLLAWRRKRFGKVTRDPVMVLLATMIAFALLPLARSQASHYVFPAAGLFGLLWVRATHLGALPRGGPVPVALAILMLAIGASVVAFVRPDVARRFIGLNSYSADDLVRKTLDDRDPTRGPLMAVAQSGYLLHVSGRSPAPTRLVNTSAQTATALREDPGLLLRTLDDPAVKLVAWDPTALRPDHPSFGDVFQAQDAFELQARLQRDFEPIEPVPGVWIWRRKP